MLDSLKYFREQNNYSQGAAAIQSGCVICYSEDLTNGQVVEGIKILNPFFEG